MQAIKWSELLWLGLSWVVAGLVLVVERVAGLPTLFLVVWLSLAGQTRPRWVLIQAIGVSLVLAALFGIGWSWAFLIIWLGYLVVSWRQPAPTIRWWRLLAWSLGGSWLIGGLVMTTQQLQLSWWVWCWPVVWLGALALLKWRRHV